MGGAGLLSSVTKGACDILGSSLSALHTNILEKIPNRVRLCICGRVLVRARARASGRSVRYVPVSLSHAKVLVSLSRAKVLVSLSRAKVPVSLSRACASSGGERERAANDRNVDPSRRFRQARASSARGVQ